MLPCTLYACTSQQQQEKQIELILRLWKLRPVGKQKLCYVDHFFSVQLSETVLHDWMNFVNSVRLNLIRCSESTGVFFLCKSPVVVFNYGKNQNIN